MAKQKLAPNQEDQIRSMRKEGKTPQECIDYMKETYGIDVPKWKISYICGWGRRDQNKGDEKKKRPNTRKPGSKPKRHKRKYRKNKKGKGILEQSAVLKSEMDKALTIEEAIIDIFTGFRGILDGYKSIFMHLRLEVIKEKGKVFNMAKAAGIEVTSGKLIDLKEDDDEKAGK